MKALGWAAGLALAIAIGAYAPVHGIGGILIGALLGISLPTFGYLLARAGDR